MSKAKRLMRYTKSEPSTQMGYLRGVTLDSNTTANVSMQFFAKTYKMLRNEDQAQLVLIKVAS